MSGDLGGQATRPWHPLQRYWKCWLRNAFTCLPKWGGAPSASHSFRLIWRGTSSNNTGSSSTTKRRKRSDVKCSSSTNGPMTWLLIALHQILTEEVLWKCASVDAWGLSSEQACLLCVLFIPSLLIVNKSVSAVFLWICWFPKSQWQNCTSAV